MIAATTQGRDVLFKAARLLKSMLSWEAEVDVIRSTVRDVNWCILGKEEASIEGGCKSL